MAAAEQKASAPQSSALNPPHLSLTALDRAVIVVIAALIILIGGTVLLGDRVGVQVTAIEPSQQAHSTSPITIRFSEAMNHDSVASHFHIDPAPDGQAALTW